MKRVLKIVWSFVNSPWFDLIVGTTALLTICAIGVKHEFQPDPVTLIFGFSLMIHADIAVGGLMKIVRKAKKKLDKSAKVVYDDNATK